VEEVIDTVLELEKTLQERRKVRVKVGSIQPNLTARIHPTVLQQMLITAVEQLASHSSSGQITIFARVEGANAKITLATTIAKEDRLTEKDLAGNILTTENTTLDAYVDSNRAFVWIKIPSGKKIIVLAVDDNPDLAHFYQRAVEGTRYQIEHTIQGQDLVEVIKTVVPDVIVLDIMLPDADGWKVLTHLHENPTTRAIPVIICSVVRAEELALSLGAALYLPKPVRPREFIQALDQVLSQAAE
jgi:CheY-like chemotaxis protein